MQKTALIILLLFAACSLFGQYAPVINVPFTQYGHTISAPLTGGFTASQFSDIDLNQDGINDLFVYDKGSWTFVPFLKDAAGNYTYAPQYEKIFPALSDWALLVDYNCDDVPDIFTYYNGSTKVFRGVLTAGVLSFILEKESLQYTDDTGSPINLYTSRTDLPGIADIDNDGDIDVLSFSVSNTTIRFYKNMSQESGFGCDSLNYEVHEYCWGEMYEGFSCYGGDLHVSCKGEAEDAANDLLLHIGSTIVTFDKDGDGDHDALLGDNSCNNLVYYRNGGTVDYAEIDSKDTLWPANSVEFEMPTFPGCFLIDADNDGDKDVIATTNDDLLGLNTEHIWWYENLNTNDTFDFVFKMDTFVVSQMVDAGGFSSPVFFDYDRDGLLDIVLGVSNTYGKDDVQHHGLWLYRNTGTATAPAYTLITRDFAGLGTYNMSYLSPSFCDLDNDGDQDMICGSYDGTLIYDENIAAAGGAAEFGTPVFGYQAIDVGSFSAPSFIDIDLDNKYDLVLGEQNGNLNYFHNIGTAAAPVFNLESEIWGGVDVRKYGFITGYSHPFMYRNENDSLYLLVGSQSGYVYEFNEIEDALLGEFFEADSNYMKYYPGFYATLNGADINGDGTMDFVTGNVRGGIQIMEKSYPNAINSNLPIPAIFIYPNPAENNITVQCSITTNSEWEILDVAGRVVAQGILSENFTVIPVTRLSEGLYYLVVNTESGSSAGSFIKISH